MHLTAGSDNYDLAERFRRFFCGLVPFIEVCIAKITSANIREKDSGELVSEADTFLGQKIFLFLGETFPKDEILDEETERTTEDLEKYLRKERCWLVDQLDGTHNMLLGLLNFGIMIALVENGVVTKCFIFLPFERNGFYCAFRGGGAWWHTGMKYIQLRVSDETEINKTFLLTEGPSSKLFSSDFVIKLTRATRRTRTGLASCYSCTRVASGNILPISADILLTVGNKPTDNLPMCLLVEEAGGKVTDWDGNPWSIENYETLILANPVLHEQALALKKEKVIGKT